MKLRLDDFADDEDTARAEFEAAKRFLMSVKTRLGLCRQSLGCARPARRGMATCIQCARSKAKQRKRWRR